MTMLPVRLPGCRKSHSGRDRSERVPLAAWDRNWRHQAPRKTTLSDAATVSPSGTGRRRRSWLSCPHDRAGASSSGLEAERSLRSGLMLPAPLTERTCE